MPTQPVSTEKELRFHPIENDNPKVLAREQIQQFNEQGYLSGIRIFSEEEMVRHRAYFDRLLDYFHEQGKNSYAINGFHRQYYGLYDLVQTPRVLDIMEDLIGPNIFCTMTHYFCKLPRDSKTVSWHQDASYWPLTPTKVVTLWLAIDDVDKENAAMRFIPGSHLNGGLPYRQSEESEHNVLNQTATDVEQYGEPVDIELKAGEVSLHSDLMLHGSLANNSDRRRCGLTMRYNPPDVRVLNTETNTTILCRGEDPSGYWEASPRPEIDPALDGS